jgi:hypothetical protein
MLQVETLRMGRPCLLRATDPGVGPFPGLQNSLDMTGDLSEGRKASIKTWSSDVGDFNRLEPAEAKSNYRYPWKMLHVWRGKGESVGIAAYINVTLHILVPAWQEAKWAPEPV